jgi:formate--tetrahydrofolate ligase
MSDVKSDIQIAREAKMQPINDILAKINVPDESAAFSPMGRHIAKINLEYLDTLKDKPDGKLILVTAITPTPAGEGKTTTSVGLNDGLNKIGKKIYCLFKRAQPWTIVWYERWSCRRRLRSSSSNGTN